MSRKKFAILIVVLVSIGISNDVAEWYLALCVNEIKEFICFTDSTGGAADGNTQSQVTDDFIIEGEECNKIDFACATWIFPMNVVMDHSWKWDRRFTVAGRDDTTIRIHINPFVNCYDSYPSFEWTIKCSSGLLHSTYCWEGYYPIKHDGVQYYVRVECTSSDELMAQIIVQYICESVDNSDIDISEIYDIVIDDNKYINLY